MNLRDRLTFIRTRLRERMSRVQFNERLTRFVQLVKTSRKIQLYSLSSVVLLLVAFTYLLFTPHYFSGNTRKVVNIVPGESFLSIAQKLKEAEIIPSKAGFVISAIITLQYSSIRTGKFRIENGLSYWRLLAKLTTVPPDLVKTVLIFDGSTFDDVGTRLQQEGIVAKSQFLSDLKAYPGSDSLLGYLLPGRYFLFENSEPREVIDTLRVAFQRFFSDSLKQSVGTTGMNLREVITLASIIQWETNRKTELPRIARVYLNRLAAGMKLQACPTIQFARNERRGRITSHHLRIQSPYNTYLHVGLPPGPINNPGRAAIRAVLFPEQNDYFYFVADTKGGHHFSTSYREHQKYSRVYNIWLSKRQKLKK